MKKFGLFIVLAILVIFSFSFFGNSIVSNKVLTSERLKQRMNQKVNLLYISASWCGISQKILNEEYAKLCDSNQNFTITILSADNDLKPKLNCEVYGIKQQAISFPISNRLTIKKFIEANFTNTEILDLKGSFGIPISIFVDENLNIICKSPQKAHEIINLANYYLKNR